MMMTTNFSTCARNNEGVRSWTSYGHSSTKRSFPKQKTIGISSPLTSYTWWASVILCICCFSSDKCVLCTPLLQMTDSSTEIMNGGGQDQIGSQFQRSVPQQEKFEDYGPLPIYDTLAMAPFEETRMTPGELTRLRFLDSDLSLTRNYDNTDDNKNEEDQIADRNIDNSMTGSGQQWEMVLDPKFYIHTERESRARARRQRKRRNAGPSLSIVNPLDVLRQRLLIEIARRRFHTHKNHQINANTEYLKTIGRRRR